MPEIGLVKSGCVIDPFIQLASDRLLPAFFRQCHSLGNVNVPMKRALTRHEKDHHPRGEMANKAAAKDGNELQAVCTKLPTIWSDGSISAMPRPTNTATGLEKSGRVVAFCDWNARFCDQKTLCSRNFAPKTRRPGASLRPDEHSSRPDSENKN